MIIFFKFRFGFPNILILLFILTVLIPIIFKNFIARSSLGLSFLLSSSKFLKVDTPFDFAAIKKINKNSSIALLFSVSGQLIELNCLQLFIFISPIVRLYIIFLFKILIFAFILFKILIIPIREGFTFTFFINNSEFLDKRVNTIKNEAELISPGNLYSNDLYLFFPEHKLNHNYFFFYFNWIILNVLKKFSMIS